MKTLFMALVMAATLQSAALAQETRTGEVVLADGSRIQNVEIYDYDPPSYNPLFNISSPGVYMQTIGLLKHLKDAPAWNGNFDRALYYSGLRTISVVPLTEVDSLAVEKLAYASNVMTADVEFWDGSTMEGIFLVPVNLRYRSENVEGRINRNSVRTVIFSSPKATVPGGQAMDVWLTDGTLIKANILDYTSGSTSWLTGTYYPGWISTKAAISPAVVQEISNRTSLGCPQVVDFS